MNKHLNIILASCLLSTVSLSAWNLDDYVSSSYQHKNWIRGGYSETKLSEDMYQVNYAGNSFTSTTTAIRFTFVRAAEMTKKDGKKYFTLVDKQENHSQVKNITLNSWYYIQNDSIISNIVNHAFINYTYVFDNNSPNCSIIIKTFHEKPHQENCFDAEAIMLENTHLLNTR